MGSHSQLLNPWVKCTAAQPRWEIGAPRTCSRETVAVSLPESQHVPSRGPLAPPLHCLQLGVLGGSVLRELLVPYQFWDNPRVPRAPEDTQTLPRGPRPTPSLVKPTIYPSHPRRGTRLPETSITRAEGSCSLVLASSNVSGASSSKTGPELSLHKHRGHPEALETVLE